MDEISLAVEYAWTDGDIVQVLVSVWNGSFGGQSLAYVSGNWLEAFAAKIEGFPNRPLDFREEQFGQRTTFEGGPLPGGVTFQFCAGNTGRAHIDIAIETEIDGYFNSVRLAMPFEPASLDAFVIMLRKISLKRAGSARLYGAKALRFPSRMAERRDQ